MYNSCETELRERYVDDLSYISYIQLQYLTTIIPGGPYLGVKGGDHVNVTITDLIPNTVYNLLLYGENRKGIKRT